MFFFPVRLLSTVEWFLLENIFLSVHSLNYRCYDPRQIIYPESESLLNLGASILPIFLKPLCYLECSQSAKDNCYLPYCNLNLIGNSVANNPLFSTGVICSFCSKVIQYFFGFVCCVVFGLILMCVGNFDSINVNAKPMERCFYCQSVHWQFVTRYSTQNMAEIWC